MATFVLSAQDVISIVHKVGINNVMDTIIYRLVNALREFNNNIHKIPDRAGFICNIHNGLIEWMPIYREGKDIVIKIVSYFPHNPAKYEIPTIQAQVGIFDEITGRVKILMDAQLLTALRTGAASAIATDILSSPNSINLGLVGCGQQSVTQVHAISRVRSIRNIYAFDTCSRTLESLSERLSFLNANVIRTSSADVEKHSDILCTATSVAVNHEPVIPGENLRDHIHINAIGSDFPGKRELPKGIVQNSFICPDSLEQAFREGECQILEKGEIGPELHELVKNREQYEAWQAMRTIFDSTGIALEDAVAAEVITEYAIELGFGNTIDLCRTSLDPKDTYDLKKANETNIVNILLNKKSYFENQLA